MKKIAQGDVRELIVAVPPIQEQHEIVSVLEAFEAQQQQLVAEAEESTALLLERRAALITAAVTGQIDVRGLAVPEAS
jgi:type I restriction enzyme S subunit